VITPVLINQQPSTSSTPTAQDQAHDGSLAISMVGTSDSANTTQQQPVQEFWGPLTANQYREEIKLLTEKEERRRLTASRFFLTQLPFNQLVSVCSVFVFF
jgi:hypothetical protein